MDLAWFALIVRTEPCYSCNRKQGRAPHRAGRDKVLLPGRGALLYEVELNFPQSP
jgi:hypothetical protein